MKERILSANAQSLYGVSEAELRAADRERDRAWVSNASAELVRTIQAAGNS